MRIKRRAGRPVAPFMDEVYGDVVLLMEAVSLVTRRAMPLSGEEADRLSRLSGMLALRLGERKKELENGPTGV